MKTMNKLYRTLLMTIVLVMGVVNVQANEVTIWNSGPSSSFNVNSSLVAVGTLRVYTVSSKQIYIGTGNNSNDGEPLFFTQYNTWIRNGEFYNATNKCFEFTITSEILTKIQTGGLHIENYDNNITLVTVEGDAVVSTYVLTYVANGVTVSTVTLTEGAEVPEAPAAPSVTGYDFDHWEGIPTTMPGEDKTVTAVYTAHMHDIIYIIDEVEYQRVSTAYGTTITPITPTLTNRVFNGWNYYPGTMPDQDLEIKGTSQPAYTLTLSYNEEQGTVEASQTSYIKNNDQITVTVNPSEGFELASVVFANADGSTPNKWFQDGLYYVQFGESNVTCTVTFRQTGLVTYNVGNGTITGGNVTATPSTAAAGEEITLTLAPQSGYVLETISVTDGTNNIELSEDYKFTMPASNVTVNATFVDPASLLPKHTLTINIDGVQTTKEVAEETDLSIVLPTPTKNGYSFAGWTGMPEDGKMPTSDLELTAQFTEATYTLTFMLDNAVFGTPQQKKYGEAITTPTGIPVEDGYTFGGWQNVPATMPAQDLVIYGFHVKDNEAVKLSVGNSGYSTYYGNKALYFNGTEAVKAYVAYAIGTSVVSLRQIIGAVAANTAMVLKGDAANASATFNVVGTGDTYTNNLLKGVTAATPISGSNKYVLVEKTAEDGTKTVKFADTGNHAATVPANKAYLQAPAGANARQLTIIFEGGVTAIEAISTENDDVPAVFNLSGQQVKNPGKGLYIINGKKVIIK